MSFSAHAATPSSAEIAKQRLGLVTGEHAVVPRTRLTNQLTELQVVERSITHTPVAPPPPSRWRQGLRVMGAPFRALSHALLGAALVIVEAIPRTLAPVAFTLRNLHRIFLALVIVGAPALGAGFLWAWVPGWRESFPLNQVGHAQGWMSIGFLVGLYIALGFVAVVIGVLLRGMGRGVAGSTRALATRGETAFEEDETTI